MNAVEATYGEASARGKVDSLPLSHLSIELGHLYREDFRPGKDLVDHFRRVAPWVESATRAFGSPSERNRTRVSTCFLIDDYFAPFSTPDVVIPALQEAAAAAGVRIDYLAREAACAVSDDVELASLVMDRLVPEPAVGDDGSRPPATETGWLSNGTRSPIGGGEAMGRSRGWEPPRQNSARRHSVFVDVELWSEEPKRRVWSCAFLAAVWQLVRLGVLRFKGAPVSVPQPFRPEFIDQWENLPAVVQLNPDADPFCAYQTLSVLSTRFLLTEQAVRVILSQINVDDAVAAEITQRSVAEGFRLPGEIVNRINYVFDGSVVGDP
ncbi:SCO2522 family protein [Cryptosporangium aurantiacum]|uniref:Uncharacterized protein n=1 Tax=Cryptosporangium aurantiacum TaxID=134849 RepID=A0A1M7RJS2_9ACTN|nr:SCO2522 family protein [Cryptosporangium aurantiacum]SHN46396.1 hypothetical protein SAMN05443668_11583 [Cryptosporangium aurantiacum]